MPRHQVLPIRVAGVVIPDDDTPAGLRYARHLGEGRCDGAGLGEIVKRKALLPLSKRIQWVEELCSGLAYAHRQEDADEAMAILKATGGLEKLHMAFYQQGDLQNDKVWDIWRVEGPSFVWHFRGAPHVHAYINIGHVKKG